MHIHYACRLARTGGCVDSSRSKVGTARAPMRVVLGSGSVVEGMEAGLHQLRMGALARLHVPTHLAYGTQGAGVIPPGADLVFEVEVVGINGRRGRRGTINAPLLALLMLGTQGGRGCWAWAAPRAPKEQLCRPSPMPR